MEDIAEEAGIGRASIYRLGLSRRDLTDAAIVARLREGRDMLGPLMERDLDFAELLVEGSLATIEWARHDPELQALLGKTRTAALQRLLIGPNAVTHDIIRDTTATGFHRARAAGRMRPEVSDERAVDWIQNVFLVLLLRDDLDTEATAAHLWDFLIPALSTVEYLAEIRARSA